MLFGEGWDVIGVAVPAHVGVMVEDAEGGARNIEEDAVELLGGGHLVGVGGEGVDVCDVEAVGVLADGFEAVGVEIDGGDGAGVLHFFGDCRCFATRGTAHIEDGFIGLGAEQIYNTGCADALYGEMAFLKGFGLKEAAWMWDSEH